MIYQSAKSAFRLEGAFFVLKAGNIRSILVAEKYLKGKNDGAFVFPLEMLYLLTAP